MTGIIHHTVIRLGGRGLALVALLLAAGALGALGAGRPAPATAAPATAALKLFWHSVRQDNVLCATTACEQDALATGYRFIRIEGAVEVTQQPGTAPLKLYWHGGRKDNAACATTTCEQDQLAVGYRFVRTEGYVYTSQSNPALVPLKLFWHSGRQDNVACATVACAQDQTAVGYRLIRTEGYVLPPSAPAPTTPHVRLCSAINFGGMCHSVSTSIPDLRAIPTPPNTSNEPTWDNIVSSVATVGTAVALYELPNYQGRCETIRADSQDSDLRDNLLGNDTLSSFKVNAACTPGVWLCREANYGGFCQFWADPNGVWDMSSTSLGNEQASSVHVELSAGRVLNLCELTGGYLCFRTFESSATLGPLDNAISSFYFSSAVR
jgi:hypothetical protein